MDTPSVNQPPGVKGLVNANINVRTGPKITDPKLTSLKAGQEVWITGYSIDPQGGEFARRYRIQLQDRTAWTSASAIDAGSVQGRRALPFVPYTLAKPASELLRIVVGLTLKEEVDLAEAEALASLLWDAALIGIDNKTELDSVVASIRKFEAFGIVLGVEQGGKWSPEELKILDDSISRTAFTTSKLLEAMTSVDNAALAFRLLYAPLRVTRSGRDNVNPRGDAVWYAKNTNGYELVFGNKVFTPGPQRTKVNPTVPFTSMELVTHEIAHVINWRYPRKPGMGAPLNQDLADMYGTRLAKGTFTLPDGQRVVLRTFNDGYGMAARSSDGPYETVTDGIACWSLDRFTIGAGDPTRHAQGLMRKHMITNLMQTVMSYRITRHGGLKNMWADVLAKRSSDPALPQKLSPALELLAAGSPNFDEQLADLQGRLK
jgi:hypothetical protein